MSAFGLGHATSDEQITQTFQDLLTGHPALHVDRQALPRELIDRRFFFQHLSLPKSRIARAMVQPTVVWTHTGNMKLRINLGL